MVEWYKDLFNPNEIIIKVNEQQSFRKALTAVSIWRISMVTNLRTFNNRKIDETSIRTDKCLVGDQTLVLKKVPNCRCTTGIYIDEKTMEGLKRRARDPETGEVQMVPATMTWKEWKKNTPTAKSKSDHSNKTESHLGHAKLIEPLPVDKEVTQRAKIVEAKLQKRERTRIRAKSLMPENVKDVGSFDKKVLGRLAEIVDTEEVVFTQERLSHIIDSHQEAANAIFDNVTDVIEKPDFVIQDMKKDNTVHFVKKAGDQFLSVVIRLHTVNDKAGLKNSILTGWLYGDRKFQKKLKKREGAILYTREEK